MKTYKAIKGPQTIDLKKSENISDAAQTFSDFLNIQAAEGWEYNSSSTLNVDVKGGCLRKGYSAKYAMMLFEKDSDEEGEHGSDTGASFDRESIPEQVAEEAPPRKKSGWKIILPIILVISAVAIYFLLLQGNESKKDYVHFEDRGSIDTASNETDGAASEEVPAAPEDFVGKAVAFPVGTTFYDSADAVNPIDMTGEAEKGVVLEDAGELVRVRTLDFYNHVSFDGWCRKDCLTVEKDTLAFSADTPLDFDAAKEMFGIYTSLPYWVFYRLNKLNFDDCYPITWDDGTVAAYAYTADGVGGREDYLKAYAEICTGVLLEQIDFDDYPETVILGDKYYFTHIYARGGNYSDPLELQQISDTEYVLITTPGYPIDPEDPTRDYYKIIVEDGKYKFSDCTSY